MPFFSLQLQVTVLLNHGAAFKQGPVLESYPGCFDISGIVLGKCKATIVCRL